MEALRIYFPTYAREIGRTGSNSKNISAFLVDTDSQGINIREMKNKIGILTVKNAEMSFHNCIIPKTNLLGQKSQGLNIAYSALIDGRLSVAAGAIGVMKDYLNESVPHAKTRVQHGSLLAKKAIITKRSQTVVVRLA